MKHNNLPIYYVDDFLEFEEWYDIFEEFINIELAENGADRELDFDIEQEFEDRYLHYLNVKDN